MASDARVLPNRSGAINISLPKVAAAVVLLAALTALLITTQSEVTALATVAVVACCACLIIIPTFWLGALLIVLIPFQPMISELLGEFGSTARQVFAAWKVVLLLVGIIRVLHNNPHRRQIMEANRWILTWSCLLILAYCVAFLRAPSIAAVISLDFETRFIGVMWFFTFLQLDERRTAILLRLMLWSIGLLAIYGIIQYFWDYERLLPFCNDSDPFDYGQRRLYSYSLNALEPAYAAVIAILILFSGVLRNRMLASLGWIAIIVPCLLLTYTRSAYIGLLVGAIILCSIDRAKSLRLVAVSFVSICLVSGILLMGGDATSGSSLGQRLQSIVSQNDESSVAHKELMRRAVQVITANPLGVGLGKYGTVEARYVGVHDAQYTENWALQVAVGAGLVAAFLFAGLTVTVFCSLLRRRFYKSRSDSLTVAAVSTLTAMTVASLMIPVWDFQIPVVYTWALVGMAIALRAPREPYQFVSHIDDDQHAEDYLTTTMPSHSNGTEL